MMLHPPCQCAEEEEEEEETDDDDDDDDDEDQGNRGHFLLRLLPFVHSVTMIAHPPCQCAEEEEQEEETRTVVFAHSSTYICLVCRRRAKQTKERKKKRTGAVGLLVLQPSFLFDCAENNSVKKTRRGGPVPFVSPSPCFFLFFFLFSFLIVICLVVCCGARRQHGQAQGSRGS